MSTRSNGNLGNAERVRRFNSYLATDRPRASWGLPVVWNALSSFTGNGERPFYTSTKKLLDFMGLSRTDENALRRVKKALQVLREDGWIESYSKGAGKNQGSLRFIILRYPEDQIILTRSVRAALRQMNWHDQIIPILLSPGFRNILRKLKPKPEKPESIERGDPTHPSKEVVKGELEDPLDPLEGIEGGQLEGARINTPTGLSHSQKKDPGSSPLHPDSNPVGRESVQGELLKEEKEGNRSLGQDPERIGAIVEDLLKYKSDGVLGVGRIKAAQEGLDPDILEAEYKRRRRQEAQLCALTN